MRFTSYGESLKRRQPLRKAPLKMGPKPSILNRAPKNYQFTEGVSSPELGLGFGVQVVGFQGATLNPETLDPKV